MNFFKRTLPIWIVLVLGFLMILQYYVPTQASENLLLNCSTAIRLIGAFTLLIGTTSLLRTHYFKVKRQASGWAFSVILYIAFATMIFFGFTSGIEVGTPFMWLFNNVQVPLTATTFSLTAFFICSAAFRAFRAKNFEATIMLIAAIIVMIGRIPIGEMISSYLPHWFWGLDKITSWILDYPSMATRRALLLGISLGGIATSLRIILGIERSYQGKD